MQIADGIALQSALQIADVHKAGLLALLWQTIQ
jgi:hypothetical protein